MKYHAALMGALLGAAMMGHAQTAGTPVQPGYFRQPAINANNIVFVAEGDLWRTGVSGGTAQRLTSNFAAESNPAISPDGTQLAFTGRYEGPAEVYVMPLSGGTPKRLTFDGDTALVQGWTQDGRVLYNSPRQSGKPDLRLYTIHPATREVKPVPLSEAAEGCYTGTSLYFTRRGAISDNVKGYKGGLAQSIWKFDEGREAVPLTKSHGGTSRQPMCAAGRIYFLSDRDGTMNIWSLNNAGADLQQHTAHRDFDIRGASISPDGKIAYQRGADLYLFDTTATADKRDALITINLQSDFEQLRTRWVKTPWDFVTAVEVSPNGDRVVLTARGQAFVAPVGVGRRVEATRVSDVRIRSAAFSADGKSILAFGDRSGEMELWRYPANGVGEGKQLTKNATVLRQRFWPSPDGKWIAHVDKDRRLYLLNPANGEEREIDRAAFGLHDDVQWSSDSRWIVLEKGTRSGFQSLTLMDVAGRNKTALTSERYHAHDAAFSPDGKWLYFMSDRHLQSVVGSPWGPRNPEPFFDRQTKIYALALDTAARWPFLPKDELQRADPEKKPDTVKTIEVEKKTVPEKKPATDKKPEQAQPPKPAEPGEPVHPKGDSVTEATADVKSDSKPGSGSPGAAPASATAVNIRLEGLTTRLYEVPVPPGNYNQLTTDGKRLYFLVADSTSDQKKSLRSVAIEAPNPAPPAIDLFFDDVRSYQLSQDRKKILIRRANDLWVFDAGKSPPPPADQGKFAVNLRDWTFPVDPREEWKQMFVDAWRMHRDYFYDKNMQGADWKKVRSHYEPLVARVTERSELNDVLGQMTAEAAALHSQVGASDVRKGADAIDVAGLAADMVMTDTGFRVTRLYQGDPELLDERGPLAKSEVAIVPGETITAVNGVPAKSARAIGELLRNQVGKQVLLAVTSANGRSRDVIVTPVTTRRDRELRYLAWERDRQAMVDKGGNNRIGYVHLQAMGATDIARWAREFYPVIQRDGLIIDLRNNRGGNIDSWIIEKLQRRTWQFWQSRDTDEPFTNQQAVFRGHTVALIDANTYSDGETMAQGLRRLGIAPLIGMTTAGAGIWLSDQNTLRDNGIARVAEFGSFVDDGKERAWITEGIGVAPDMEVDNLPHATFNGGDAQLEAAIRYLSEKIAKEPVRAPVVPAFPVRKK
ncbi:MAG: S41 family peptidase [Betaproteobacteria bacterium]